MNREEACALLDWAYASRGPRPPPSPGQPGAFLRPGLVETLRPRPPKPRPVPGRTERYRNRDRGIVCGIVCRRRPLATPTNPPILPLF